MIARWLREPLLQFLVVGVLLFVGWRAVSPDSYARIPINRIELTDDDLAQLATTWMMAGRAPPSAQQMQRLVDDRVREEVLYREALALGLDKDDTIVKRQLARKMEFLAEDVSKLEEPEPGELKAWFEKNGERFALPPRVTFRHVYFSPDRRGAMVRNDAERALTRLASKPIDAPDIATAGDPFMFQQFYGDRPFDEIARQFGPSFARALLQLAPGGWAGPIESGYGWHIVFAESLTPQRVPDYEEIESEVKAAWIEDRRNEVRARMYEAMLARYEVVLPVPRESSPLPTTGVVK
jgi:peptidyl-prolyl cis-trans isomerase C